MPKINPQLFWNEKILNWEKDKYEKTTLPWIDPNASVKFRQQLAQKILTATAFKKNIIELGCGSGKVTPWLIQAQASQYTGYDMSDVAISEAKKNCSTTSTTVIQFKAESLSSNSEFRSDLCFSLGLLDWLSLSEVRDLNQKIKAPFYFHSFSERRNSFQQWVHKKYVNALYGHRTETYIPQYYSEAEIVETFQNSDLAKPRFFRHPRLSFGCIAYHLPAALENYL